MFYKNNDMIAKKINMNSRRYARECSLQMLYIVDNCKTSTKIVCDVFVKKIPKNNIYKKFTMDLFFGVCNKKKYIDLIIKKYVKNWDIERMIVVDRNIIRIAIYEIIFFKFTPINVIINEAIEISKKYSTQDSRKFINGILDKVKIIRVKDNLK
jgi:transcription antitermination factor NusB